MNLIRVFESTKEVFPKLRLLLVRGILRPELLFSTNENPTRQFDQQGLKEDDILKPIVNVQPRKRNKIWIRWVGDPSTVFFFGIVAFLVSYSFFVNILPLDIKYFIFHSVFTLTLWFIYGALIALIFSKTSYLPGFDAWFLLSLKYYALSYLIASLGMFLSQFILQIFGYEHFRAGIVFYLLFLFVISLLFTKAIFRISRKFLVPVSKSTLIYVCSLLLMIAALNSVMFLTQFINLPTGIGRNDDLTLRPPTSNPSDDTVVSIVDQSIIREGAFLFSLGDDGIKLIECLGVKCVVYDDTNSQRQLSLQLWEPIPTHIELSIENIYAPSFFINETTFLLKIFVTNEIYPDSYAEKIIAGPGIQQLKIIRRFQPDRSSEIPFSLEIRLNRIGDVE